MNPLKKRSVPSPLPIFLFVVALLMLQPSCDTKTPPLGEDNLSSPADVPRDSLTLLDPDSLSKLADEYKRNNKPDSALYFHKEALAIREMGSGNAALLVQSYNTVASLYLKGFKYDIANKYLERARTIADTTAMQPDLLIEVYFNLADCKLNMKDFPTAISLLGRTLSLVDENYPGNTTLSARAYQKLSTTYYYHKKYAESIENALRAISLIPANDFENLANYYTTLGGSYREIGQYEKALDCFNKAIHYDLRRTGPDSDEIAVRCVFKAYSLLALGSIDSARFYLQRNLRIRSKIHGAKNVNTFGAKYSLGKFFEAIANYDSAASYYQGSLTSLIKNFSEKNWKVNPVPLEDEMNTDLIIGLVGKASALSELYKKDTLRLDLLEHALSTYVLADSVFSIYRRNFIDDDPQLVQLESGYIPYPRMVHIAYTLFRAKKDLKYLESALRIMERSRAVVLQNSLLRAEAYGKAGISDKLRMQENKLLSTRQNVLQVISESRSPEISDSLQKVLLETNHQHQRLLNTIEGINPQYFSIKYTDDPITVASVQRLLKKKNAILLEYLWGESDLYILEIAADTVIQRIAPIDTVMRKAYREVTAEMTGEFSTIYDKRRFQNFCSNAHFLYTSLIGDALSVQTPGAPDDRSVIISPDGPLDVFPFETLLSKNPESSEVNYRLPYLALTHSVSYVFSSGLLIKQADVTREGDKFMAFSFSSGVLTERDSASWSEIPGTEKEVSAIRETLSGDENEFFFGNDASESAFKQQAGKFNIVHLALHGVGDTLNALNSHLIFRSEKDTAEDGRLFAHELYDLNLQHLDLAVLSACESGIGKFQTGEGIMSIARSFAYGGCPSLVMSLWKVDDRSASQLMRNFYQYLSEGNDVDISLALARRDYLASANEFSAHPVYWAAFIQIGEPGAVFRHPTSWVKWAVAFSAILILLLFGVRNFSFGPQRPA